MTPLIEQAQIVGIEIPPSQQIQQTINQLKTELKTVRADSPTLRKHMMKAQAIRHDSTGNTKGARAVRAILRTEERLEAYKTYKVISGVFKYQHLGKIFLKAMIHNHLKI